MVFGLLLSGCASPSLPRAGAHLQPAPEIAGNPPPFVEVPPLPPRPQVRERQELYSVVMQHVEVQDLLFALARDAKLNVDIHPDIEGTVSMNVRDQTLTEILERVARQVDMRYELRGNSLSILPDSPFLKHYRVDYPNIRRDARTSISTSTDVASTGAAPGVTAGGGSGSNASTSSVENTSNNRFWDTLIANLKDLLRETDKVLPEGTSETVTEQSGLQSTTGVGSATVAAGKTAPRPAQRSTNPAAILAASPNAAALSASGTTVVKRSTFREAAAVIAHPESGNISVRASQSQHEKVREFLDRVLASARRQVLIEATIVEVDLSSRYQQGINWSLVQTAGSGAGSRIDLLPAGPGTGLQTGGLVSSLANLTLKQFRLWGGNQDLSAMLSLLESFGTLRVLSSPKISVLNNQNSVLKVVDNKVYFSLNVTAATYSAGVLTQPATYSTSINTVPIGFLMTVVPQISEANEVTLNLRPTISRITGYATDPNPALAQYNVVNRVPEVQTREMESVLRVQSGDIAVLGGLMQDTRNDASDEVPGLNRVPGLSKLFSYRNDSSQKSELVIFLRPTVLYDASLIGDFRGLRSALSDARSAFDRGPSSSRMSQTLPRD
jgi:general secretion pathway protein D